MLGLFLNAPSGLGPMTSLAAPDEAQAIGTLLVRVIKRDDAYDLSEVQRLDRMLSKLYGLSPEDATRLRAMCETMERDAPDTEVFSEMVRLGVDFDHRFRALSSMWSVVRETEILRQADLDSAERTRAALGLSHADSASARSKPPCAKM